MKAAALPLTLAMSSLASGVVHRDGRPQAAALFATNLEAVVDPADMDRCVKKVKGFLKEPALKKIAIEAATDNCAVSKLDKARNYVCPHMKSLLVGAFRSFPEDKKLDAAKFCEMSEFHTLRMRGATRVPNVGRGSLMDYTIKKECKPTVLGAMSPAKALKAGEVADFWYSLCLNQDCAHLLPSRTKWCKVDRQPTHGVEVCNLARDFAGSNAQSYTKNGDAGPEELCKLYDDFVDTVKSDVEAYDHYVHGRSRERVPVPDSSSRALNSAKMMNDAQAHKLRDNAGRQVEPAQSGAPTAAQAAVALAVLAFVA